MENPWGNPGCSTSTLDCRRVHSTKQLFPHDLVQSKKGGCGRFSLKPHIRKAWITQITFSGGLNHDLCWRNEANLGLLCVHLAHQLVWHHLALDSGTPLQGCFNVLRVPQPGSVADIGWKPGFQMVSRTAPGTVVVDVHHPPKKGIRKA